MCGIAGFAGLDDPALLRTMAASLEHRGPDAEGFYTASAVGLASRRLSVIDLETGNQPIANEARDVWVVFNGEIYNCDELRERLQQRGHRFSTKSDTECIVHLYEDHGLDFVQHLRGMFAIALWDVSRQRLVLARDRIGEKPLYYAADGARLFFGSECKAILQAVAGRRVDHQAVCDYLALGYVAAPRTFFSGISKLPPAHLLTFESGRVTTSRYWTRAKGSSRAIPYDAAEHELAARLEDTVRLCLKSDVEVGAFLSGGVDSSVAVALMRPHVAQLQTFAVGYRGAAAGFNELQHARRVAKDFGTEHHEVIVDGGDQLHLLPKVLWHYDEPNGEPTSLLVYQLSEFVRQRVKVAVSGTGGDEIFAGYPRYAAVRMREMYLRLPRVIRRQLVERLVSRWPESTRGARFARRARRFVAEGDQPADAAYVSWVSLLTRDTRAKLLEGSAWADVDDPAGDRVLLSYLMDSGRGSLLDRAAALDVEQYLPEYQLTYVDRMSMAHGLEVRAPLSDFELVDFVTSLPIDYRLAGRHTKHIFKRVARRWISPEIAERKKVGFDSPVGQWFKDSLRPFLERFMAPEQVARTGLLNPAAVSGMVADHLGGRRDYSLQLWSLVTLEAWHRMYIEDRITDGRGYRLDDLRGAAAPPASVSVSASPTPADPAADARVPAIHRVIRGGLRAYLAAAAAARAVGRRPRPVDARGCDLLLTGSFESESWVEHHLRPLTLSPACASVTMVATSPIQSIDKLTVVHPPAWLQRLVGTAAARLLVFSALAIRQRPDVLGGFHLLFNGLVATALAPLSGSRSMYICVGGPMEVLDGGILAENKLFNHLHGPDAEIERLLARAGAAADIIVTMGTRAATFWRDRGARGDVQVIPGGLDPAVYYPSTQPPTLDVVFVGRLAPIKRPDLLLRAIDIVRRRLPEVSLAIVGDGERRPALEQLTRELGLERNVTFMGQRRDVAGLLRQARLFVLASESEGVALSLMEALACGVPAIVPDVGDLADVVTSGENGFLLQDHTPEAFAARIVELLSDPAARARCATAALRSAQAFTREATGRRWEAVLPERPAAADDYSFEASRRSIRSRIAGSSR